MTDALPGTQPIPLCPPAEPITGESHAHLLEPLERLAGELGYQVQYRPIDGSTGGWCDSRRGEIIVDEQLPANAKVRVLVHEIAHSLGVGYTEYGRAQAEVLVDTVTYVVLAGQAGLDVSGESIPYVAGWGEQGALDAIRAFAGTIDQIARRIEEAITPRRCRCPPTTPASSHRWRDRGQREDPEPRIAAATPTPLGPAQGTRNPRATDTAWLLPVASPVSPRDQQLVQAS